jgi:hypothetical protein
MILTINSNNLNLFHFTRQWVLFVPNEEDDQELFSKYKKLKRLKTLEKRHFDSCLEIFSETRAAKQLSYTASLKTKLKRL